MGNRVYFIFVVRNLTKWQKRKKDKELKKETTSQVSTWWY